MRFSGFFSVWLIRVISRWFALCVWHRVVLELLQIFIPDRDARVVDTLEKLVGGAAGILAGKALLLLSGSQKPSTPSCTSESQSTIFRQSD
jgi:VanZ family protein